MHTLIALIIFSVTSWAYIPKFWMIVSRTAENHGRNVYVIDQDVTIYPAEGQALVVAEQWLVNGERNLRLRAKSKKNFIEPMDLTFIYDSKKKTYIGSDQKRRSVVLREDWLETYFYFRNVRFLKNKLKNMNAIPASALAPEKKYKNTEEIKHESEYYLRLSRLNGRVNYAIGLPTPVGADPLPGIWIEQDAFNISKLRLPSQVEVVANDYVRYPNNLWLPKTREIRWNGNRAVIKLNNVKYRPLSSFYRKRFSPNSLDLNKEPHLAAKIPEIELLKEFYTRFR